MCTCNAQKKAKEANDRKNKAEMMKKNAANANKQLTDSLLEKVPTKELELARAKKIREVNEEDTLYGYSFSMSERLFEDEPPKQDSDIERVKITGRPKRQTKVKPATQVTP
ncbi:hypothetical protein M3Y94_00425300 [Aphelenchoides besseyi]|nr:hypothetical protein M3Y94_00425300 [Aphelenchoides besseyi]